MNKLFAGFILGFILSTAFTLYDNSLIEGYIADYCGIVSK